MRLSGQTRTAETSSGLHGGGPWFDRHLGRGVRTCGIVTGRRSRDRCGVVARLWRADRGGADHGGGGDNCSRQDGTGHCPSCAWTGCCHCWRNDYQGHRLKNGALDSCGATVSDFDL